jgi:hypothetical protein
MLSHIDIQIRILKGWKNNLVKDYPFLDIYNINKLSKEYQTVINHLEYISTFPLDDEDVK